MDTIQLFDPSSLQVFLLPKQSNNFVDLTLEHNISPFRVGLSMSNIIV